MKNSDYKTDLQCVYNNIASHFSKTRHYIWPEMREFLPYLPAHSHIIDIGCGNGRLLQMLQNQDYTYVGIDQAAELLAEAKKLWPNYVFEQADMTLYHYGRDRFDAAFFIASLHHLDNHDLQVRTLQKVVNALRPQGYVFITTWNMWQPKYRRYIQKDPYHHSFIPYNNGTDIHQRFYYAFNKTELVEVCKEAGLKVVEAWYSNKEERVKQSEARNICIVAQKISTT